jgi:hypothetical protein
MTESQHMSDEDWTAAREQLRLEKLAARRRLFVEALEASRKERQAKEQQG